MLRIGLSYDLKEAVPVNQKGPEDALEEYDSVQTVKLITSALQSLGHQVVMLGGGKEFLANILSESVDFVFNIAEGRGTYRSREAQVPAVLEMLGIPYSGSDPECLSICLDKPLTKQIVAASGVYTPRWQLIKDNRDLERAWWKEFPFPAIIKPAYEGSSKGIRLSSVVDNPEQAIEISSKLLESYQQPVIAEEFITGDEVTVGMIGNAPPRVLGTMRILPRKKVDYFVYSLEVKRDWRQLVEYEAPAQLSKEVMGKIMAFSLRAFEATWCRDFARIDFRVSSQGIPYFLEINPLPGLGDYSDLVIMALKLGWSYEALIGAILSAALERYPSCVRE